MIYKSYSSEHQHLISALAMQDQIIIIPNVLVEDCKIRKVLSAVESSAFQAKALNIELFELTMREMMFSAGILLNRTPREPSITRLAMNSMPGRNSRMSEEEHDELYDEQYETIKYASEEISNHVNYHVIRAFQSIQLNGDKYRQVEFYYGIPDAGAISLMLTNRTEPNESIGRNYIR